MSLIIKYRKDFISAGMVIGVTSPDENLVEYVEVQNNDFFVGDNIIQNLKVDLIEQTQ